MKSEKQIRSFMRLDSKGCHPLMKNKDIKQITIATYKTGAQVRFYRITLCNRTLQLPFIVRTELSYDIIRCPKRSVLNN